MSLKALLPLLVSSMLRVVGMLFGRPVFMVHFDRVSYFDPVYHPMPLGFTLPRTTLLGLIVTFLPLMCMRLPALMRGRHFYLV